jgi:hypothetical protein
MGKRKTKKLKALIIEPVHGKWGMVAMSELTSEKWLFGMTIITSIEDVIKRSIKECVPIITREVFEKLNKELLLEKNRE